MIDGLFEPSDFDALAIQCGLPLTWVDRNMSEKIARHANELLGDYEQDNRITALEEKEKKEFWERQE